MKTTRKNKVEKSKSKLTSSESSILKEPSYYVVLDTETTDSVCGDILEIGAIRVSEKSGDIIGSYYASLPKLPSAKVNEAGLKHYDKIAGRCDNAFSVDHTIDEFMTWLRGPLSSEPPMIMGYCSTTRDMPILMRYCTKKEHEWIFSAKQFDVFQDQVDTKWKKEDGFERRQEVICGMLGIPVDVSKLHDPLYDCKLTLSLHLVLREIESGRMPMPNMPKSKTDISQYLSSQEAINRVRVQASNPKYTRLVCPCCHEPTARMWVPKFDNVKSADDWFYLCENPSCCGKKENGKPFSFNFDGTKGRYHQTRVCDIDEQVIPAQA